LTVGKTGDRNDPFLAFRFEVTLDDLKIVGGFSECTGLSLDTEVLDYIEGGVNDHVQKFPTRTKQANIVLKRGVVDRVMWDWYFGLTQGVITFRNGSILVNDAAGGEPVMVWNFRQAFPCKFSGPELNAMQSNIAVETFELAHQGLERVT
jgi:phage tail-like protein